MRYLWALLSLIVVGIAGVMLFALLEARGDPLVRRVTLPLADWPAGAPPVRLALISDIHIGSFAMDAGRFGRIVDQVNALRPDIVVIAGDFINGNQLDSAARLGQPLIAPLLRLRAPLGVIAVPGNHDQRTGMEALRPILRAAHVILLENDAVTVGPLAIGGLGDMSTRHAHIDPTIAMQRTLVGARLMVTHSLGKSSAFPLDAGPILAGHTHCGQMKLPILGPLSKWAGDHTWMRCGLSHEHGHIVIVTSGLGTSGVPFRIGAPPDMWLITLGPQAAQP